MSSKIFIRLSADELRKLDEMVENNETTGFESRADFFRCILWREWNRRKGLPAPSAKDWQGACRTKPRKAI